MYVIGDAAKAQGFTFDASQNPTHVIENLVTAILTEIWNPVLRAENDMHDNSSIGMTQLALRVGTNRERRLDYTRGFRASGALRRGSLNPPAKAGPREMSPLSRLSSSLRLL